MIYKFSGLFYWCLRLSELSATRGANKIFSEPYRMYGEEIFCVATKCSANSGILYQAK
jgi:hypothetical protein